jgi:hypothetical protein
MNSNFILAFGGTGARCLEAFTYLCASRAVLAGARVLVIDPDSNNGNVADALGQLKRYHAAHASLEKPDAATFFSAPLNAERDTYSFDWDYTTSSDGFAARLELPSQRPEHRDLMRLLYSDTDLSMTFENGYVGRTHVGSLDLFRTLRHAFQNVRRSLAGEGAGRAAHSQDALVSFFRDLRAAGQAGEPARLMVFGSVFGGTGASGLPALPFLLDEILSDVRTRLRLGCVPLGSYFSFGPPADPDRDPDSTLHPLATQAALYHYAHSDTRYDRLYLVGAPTRRATSDSNDPGGHAQRNHAHYVEVAAALAAADFFRTPPDGSRGVSSCGTPVVSWEGLPLGKELELGRNFRAFATFCLFHARYLYPEVANERHLGAYWQRSLARRTGAALTVDDQSENRKARDFARRFLAWASEVQLSVPPPEVLFHIGAENDDAALGRVDGATRDGTLAYHHIYEGLNRMGRIEQSQPWGWYLTAVSRAVSGFADSHYRTR